MGRVFIFTMFCLTATLVVSGVVIWHSFSHSQDVLYQSEILGVKAVETRENVDVGSPLPVDPNSPPDLPVDYTDLTPGLQELLRDGEANEEITVDRIR